MANQEYLVIDKLTIREIARLFSHVEADRSTGCWNWIGELNHAGYGKFFYRGKKRRAHRLTYAWLIEPIPVGGGGLPELDHVVCDNHRCCNPAHLRLVTHEENMLRTRKETCLKGHPLDEARTVIRSDASRYGERACRVCERERGIRYRARQKILKQL